MRLSHPFKTVFVLLAGLLLASTVSGANLPLEAEKRLGEFFSDSGVTLARSPAKSLNALENFLNYGPAASECCIGPDITLVKNADETPSGNFSNLDDPPDTFRSPNSPDILRAGPDHPQQTGTFVTKDKTSNVESDLSKNKNNNSDVNNANRTPNEAGFVREFVTEKDQIFYRVYSGDATAGKFLTSVPPKNSALAQEGLALPRANNAEYIQEVLVPAGTKLKRSRAKPIEADEIFPDRRGGLEQFELLEQIPIDNFGKGVPFE